MKSWDTVAIVGVGLIGGSIGLALRERKLAQRVIGIGRSRASLETARRLGTIDEATLDISAGARDAELIVVCTPVGRVVQHIQSAAEVCPRGALITDAGSTKAEIVRGVGKLPRDVQFVGSHPLAGSEKTGPAQARADLLEEKIVVVTPAAKTPAAAVQAVKSFWESLGAMVVSMSPARHDKLLATTSHVPHLVAAALSASIPAACRPFAASGLRDTTRIAGGDVELWEQIVASNRNSILKSLDRFGHSLAAFRKAIARGNNGRLAQLLRKGKRNRDALGY